MKNVCAKALGNEFESSLNTIHTLTVEETKHLSCLDKTVYVCSFTFHLKFIFFLSFRE